MSESTVNLPPPPPPGTASPLQLEELEEMIFDLKVKMETTNVRRRFKMSTYQQWCEKIASIHARIQELRGSAPS